MHGPCIYLRYACQKSQFTMSSHKMSSKGNCVCSKYTHSSSLGSPLGSLELSLPGTTRPHLQLSRPPSLSGDSSLYQWSVPQSQHIQSDSYPGSPLAYSGSPALPYEQFRSISSLSHRSNDQQMEEL